MNIDGRVCYDSCNDAVLGTHSNVHVVMIRCLFPKWRQPIYYDFDVTMTSELLKSIISEVENCNIHVVAVTCDIRGREFKSLERIMCEKSFFGNPVRNDKNIFFGDVPHRLKLSRNHFHDGTEVKHKTIDNLLEQQRGDLTITRHIKLAHLSIRAITSECTIGRTIVIKS